MPSQTEISPNEPDVMPDYVDVEPRLRAKSDRLPGPVVIREMEGPPPDYMDMNSAHLLNAEFVPGEAAPRLSDPAAADAPESKHREGECIPNVPDVQPDVVADSEAVKPAVAAAEKSVEKGFTVPQWLRWGYFATTLVVVSLFGLFVFSQVISSLSMASTLPTWAQYMLLVPFAACALVVVGVCVSLVASWIRLRAVRQVNVAALEELRLRAETRKDGIQHFEKAQRQLERYLKDFPLEGYGAVRLAEAGCSTEILESLEHERDYLVGRATDSESWLEDFRNHFQIQLDKTAAARVNSWSLKAAGCVMASPLPLLDSILILGISLKMIKDLCTIYNVRSGRTSTFVLMNKAVIAAFIAGIVDEASGMAGEMLGQEVGSLLGDTAVGTLSTGFARVVAPKLGEGAVNCFFIRRLGKATIRLLQPLRPR